MLTITSEGNILLNKKNQDKYKSTFYSKGEPVRLIDVSWISEIFVVS